MDPRAGVRLGTVVGAAVLSSAAVLSAQGPATPFHGELVVRRAEITARVLDRRGRALPGLGRDDFEVVIDGRTSTPETVEWIDGWPGMPPVVPTARGWVETPAVEVRPPGGRLFVCFFQLDFHRSRLAGLVRMAHRAEDLIETLQPADRLAVVVFDSHLELHLDFTGDQELMLEAVRPTALFGEVVDPPSADGPSLQAHLDLEAAQRAAHPDVGLAVLGRALQEIPGAKSVVFLGWGIGRFSRSGVRMRRDYSATRNALVRAQTTVFTLDVTEADYHSLEVGLQQVAGDTGGFYARTHNFPMAAMDRLVEAVDGHYVLVVEAPTAGKGPHPLEVRLTRKAGTVLARGAL